MLTKTKQKHRFSEEICFQERRLYASSYSDLKHKIAIWKLYASNPISRQSLYYPNFVRFGKDMLQNEESLCFKT